MSCCVDDFRRSWWLTSSDTWQCCARNSTHRVIFCVEWISWLSSQRHIATSRYNVAVVIQSNLNKYIKPICLWTRFGGINMVLLSTWNYFLPLMRYIYCCLRFIDNVDEFYPTIFSEFCLNFHPNAVILLFRFWLGSLMTMMMLTNNTSTSGTNLIFRVRHTEGDILMKLTTLAVIVALSWSLRFKLVF